MPTKRKMAKKQAKKLPPGPRKQAVQGAIADLARAGGLIPGKRPRK